MPEGVIVKLELTREELTVLKQWLGVIGFAGTRAELRGAFAVYDALIAKIDAALETTPDRTISQPTEKQN